MARAIAFAQSRRDGPPSRPFIGNPPVLQISLTAPWLLADLGRTRQVLSFAPHHPGFHWTRHILLREVRDQDLTPDFDAIGWLGGQMDAQGHAGDVGMMTSRGLEHFQLAQAGQVHCLATVGLGNAERVGHLRAAPRQGYGTINLALLIDAGLTQTAMIEALTIASEARTLAVLEAGIALPTGLATGTGTDCIALAADAGDLAYAGLHTDLGCDIGRAVHDAVAAGARDWVAVHGRRPPDQPG